MQKVNQSRDKWRYVAFFLTGILIAVADQLSKTWIRTNLPEGNSLFEIGIFRINHLQNTGAAFGVFQGQSFILTIIAMFGIAVVLSYILVLYRRYPLRNTILGHFVLGLVFGGSVGNVIDRLRFGYVTDFIDFGFWPAFNVADSAVTIGVIVLAYCLLRSAQAETYPDGQNI